MHWIYAHLIGDYLLTTDWITLNKKTSSFICTIHVICYMLPFIFTGLSWYILLLIGIQHFLQDRTSFVIWFMRIKKSTGFTKEPFAPWSIILIDNILHILFIAFVVSIN